MNAEVLLAVQIIGLCAIAGALIYAVGDVLLLAGKASLEDYPNLQPHAKPLSGMERLVGLSWQRMTWGGLLGVFATPLIVAGFWQVYQGMLPAGLGLALPPLVLFGWASMVGAFVHGSFIYLGEYVQALNRLDPDSQPTVLEMIARHRKIMTITYAFLFGCIIIASIWFSILVAFGESHFPRWMALVNPVTAFLVWMVVKRVLPRQLTDQTEGAGFNIAYLIFFCLTTWTLWNGF
jgi:hypothetical protein